jgi:YHS domain-containing protein
MSTQKISTKKAIDPVCGMAVVANVTDLLTTIKGQKYYFCAEGCRQAFEENPQKFLDPKPQKRKGVWGRYMDRLQKATGGKAQKCH